MTPLSKAQQRERRISLLSMYVLGIAVGCIMVGMLLSMKRAILRPGTPPPGAPNAQTTPPGPPQSPPQTPPAPVP